MTAAMTDDRPPPSSAARPPAHPSGRPAEGRVRLALVADRDPLLREGLRLYLETLGWQAVAGRTVDEGLGLLARMAAQPPDCPPGSILPGPIAPDLIVMGETERRGAATPWPSLLDRLAAVQGTVRTVLLSIAASNHELMIRARDRGFDTIHLDLAPLNLDALLLGYVRRIEGGRN